MGGEFKNIEDLRAAERMREQRDRAAFVNDSQTSGVHPLAFGFDESKRHIVPDASKSGLLYHEIDLDRDDGRQFRVCVPKNGPSLRQAVKEGFAALDELSAAIEALEVLTGPILRPAPPTMGADSVKGTEPARDMSSEVVADLIGQTNRIRATARRLIEIANRLEV